MINPNHLVPIFLAGLVFVGCGEEIEDEPQVQPEEPVVASFEVHVAGAIDEILIEDMDPEPQAKPTRAAAGARTQKAQNAKSADNQKTKKPHSIGPRRPQLTHSSLLAQERSQSDIRNTIRTSLPQVKACYERELKKRPTLEGKVVARWTIDAAGRVQSPRVRTNTTSSSELSSCITRTLSGWRFASAAHASDVEYPFTFRPRETW